MQVTLCQNIYGDLICQVREVKEEIEKDYYHILKRYIEKEYSVYSNYKIIGAYMLSEYKVVIQLYEEKTKSYTVVEI